MQRQPCTLTRPWRPMPEPHGSPAEPRGQGAFGEALCIDDDVKVCRAKFARKVG